jgi:hypothetical protein
MSFIFENKDLIKQLIDAGVSFNKKFAQAAPPVDNAALYDLAKRLAITTQRELGDPNAPKKSVAPVGSEKKDPVTGKPMTDIPFSIPNARSLGQFITWLAENQITWNNHRFAWLGTEANVPGTAQALSSQTADYERFPENRIAKENDVFFIKQDLADYLSYFRDTAVPSVGDDTDRKLFEVVVKNLIEDVNKFMGKDKQLSTKAQTKPVSDLNPKDKVDGFMSNTIVLDSNGVDLSGLPSSAPDFKNERVHILVETLQDLGKFKYWILQMRVQKPGGQPINVMDQLGDPCAVVHTLYARAQFLKGQKEAIDKVKPGYAKIIDLYVRAVSDFGKQITMANGKSCAVTRPGTDKSGTDKDTGAGTGAGDTTGDSKDQIAAQRVSLQEIGRLISPSYLPLQRDQIDLSRIKHFAETYAKFDTSNRKNRAQTLLNEINIGIARANEFSLSETIPLTATLIRSLHPLMKKGLEFQMHGLFDALTYTVSKVAEMVELLGSTYGTQLNASNIVATQINLKDHNIEVLKKYTDWSFEEIKIGPASK